MGRSEQDGRHWRAATAAAARVPRWLAFRWLFAQAWNAHRPQGSAQLRTKERAKEVAQSLIAGMGGALMAPPPPRLDTDRAWQAYLRAAQALDYDQRSALMAWLLVQEWPHPSQPATCGDLARDGQRVQLALALTDLQVQQRFNAAGWRPGVGWPKK